MSNNCIHISFLLHKNYCGEYFAQDPRREQQPHRGEAQNSTCEYFHSAAQTSDTSKNWEAIPFFVLNQTIPANTSLKILDVCNNCIDVRLEILRTDASMSGSKFYVPMLWQCSLDTLLKNAFKVLN
jgi:hypothetical protein